MNDNELKHEIAEKWSKDAEYYDSHISHGMVDSKEKELWISLFASLIPDEKKIDVLDIGCGTGAMGLLFAEMGHHVEGIDISVGMMNVGKVKAQENNLDMTFCYGDAEKPSFADKSFDIIVCRHLLWTLIHPDTAIRNWHRILRSGGRVIIIDGIWEQKSLLGKLRRGISQTLEKYMEAHPHGHCPYSDELTASLPYIGGTPQTKVTSYLVDAGFSDTRIISLQRISQYQYARKKWYQKIDMKSEYYLATGIKNNAE